MGSHPRPPRPLNDISTVQEAASRAKLLRGEWLILIDDGMMSADDLLTVAETEEGRPLRKLRVEQVLAAEPERSLADARRCVAAIAKSMRYDLDSGPMTIGWLVDLRARGKRIEAWVEATAPRRLWSGFPYTPQPEGAGAVSAGSER